MDISVIIGFLLNSEYSEGEGREGKEDGKPK